MNDEIEKYKNCLIKARACLVNLRPNDGSNIDRQMGKMAGEITEVLGGNETFKREKNNNQNKY